jgi:hypothetical protein
MDSKVIVAIAGALGLIFVIVMFRPVDVSGIPKELICSTDVDCVPEQDCHANSCINLNFKEYSDAFCTANCEPGTMDCGQGSCVCVNNRCDVILNE